MFRGLGKESSIFPCFLLVALEKTGEHCASRAYLKMGSMDEWVALLVTKCEAKLILFGLPQNVFT